MKTIVIILISTIRILHSIPIVFFSGIQKTNATEENDQNC
jgi:hypothetical protein